MTPYEVNDTGEARPVLPPQISPEQQLQAQIRADAQDLEGMWNDGKAAGLYEGREDTRAALQPYVQHIGTCGAVGSDPEDSRCICGLRQIWMDR